MTLTFLPVAKVQMSLWQNDEHFKFKFFKLKALCDEFSKEKHIQIYLDFSWTLHGGKKIFSST